MSEIQWILAVLGGAAGLIVAVAAAVAFFRSNYAKATIELQNNHIRAQEQRIKQLEDSNNQKDIILATQQKELLILRDLVTGRSELKTLSATLEAYQSNVVHLAEKVNLQLQALAAKAALDTTNN